MEVADELLICPFYVLLPLPMPLSHILPSRADLVCAVFPCVKVSNLVLKNNGGTVTVTLGILSNLVL